MTPAKGKERLRSGYTTGACAAAAAKGAALMLRDRRPIDAITINLPGGREATFPLHGQTLTATGAGCFVVKDSGDDPDVTNGAEIHAVIDTEYFTPHRLVVQGGTGIGRVTKPGLAVPVGEWAINPVPRSMIIEGVKEVLAMRCVPATVTITISIPNGAELAEKTLNARLGIVGGLSILGTTGIVKPVSAKAWTDTIDCAIDVALAAGSPAVVLSTGRTSELTAQQYLQNQPPSIPPCQGGRPAPPLSRGGREGLTEESFVMMGDHVGHALRACERKGVKKVVLAGQFAKLLKIACGHMQTHVTSSQLDLQLLAEWCDQDPFAVRFASMVRSANTARQVLDLSGGDSSIIDLVCTRAKDAARRSAPGMKVRVLLAGYGGEVLYFA